MIVFHIAPGTGSERVTTGSRYDLVNPPQVETEDSSPRFAQVRSARFRQLGRKARWAIVQSLAR